ncbi:MAG: nicotinamide riboside transporter PnuC [Jatrophihabitans sp.]|uniref:nicotinamide riboside transporter PnuC n=1 Tax=Jatrophihabitans sp. TaxID=1932789 RepID=UPI003F80C945
MGWLDWLVQPLDEVVFRLGADAVTWAELLGFLTGGACVWLTVRRHVLNFPVGLANSALFLVLFADARLWADASLQVLFLVLGVLGWWQWWRSAGVPTQVPVRRSGRIELACCLALVVGGTAVLTLVLRAADDAAPFWDALTTALSVSAQWLLNNRRSATWGFWIAADIVYIPLYAAKELYLTAAVYVLFLALCLGGLRAWSRAMAGTAAPRTVEAVAA